jgi:hypothetical protein
MDTISQALYKKRVLEKAEETGRLYIQSFKTVRYRRIEKEKRVSIELNALVGIMTAVPATDQHDFVKIVAGVRHSM